MTGDLVIVKYLAARNPLPDAKHALLYLFKDLFIKPLLVVCSALFYIVGYKVTFSCC